MAIRSFMPFAYVVYLWGKHVFSGHSNICLIESHSELDDVRKLVKERYNLEFSEYATESYGSFCGCVKFSNITDNRDITLIVERIDILNVKKPE